MRMTIQRFGAPLLCRPGSSAGVHWVCFEHVDAVSKAGSISEMIPLRAIEFLL